jgi:hypothetical protein
MVQMGGKRGVQRLLVGRHEERRLVGGPRNIREDNIEMDSCCRKFLKSQWSVRLPDSIEILHGVPKICWVIWYE